MGTERGAVCGEGGPTLMHHVDSSPLQQKGTAWQRRSHSWVQNAHRAQYGITRPSSPRPLCSSINVLHCCACKSESFKSEFFRPVDSDQCRPPELCLHVVKRATRFTPVNIYRYQISRAIEYIGYTKHNYITTLRTTLQAELSRF